MKYIDIPELCDVVLSLNSIANGEARLSVSAEVYTVKQAGDDKQMYHSLNKSYESFALSPTSVSPSPFGPMTESGNRKILIFFVTTLSHAFPCYDFGEVRATDFEKEENFGVVYNRVNSLISTSFPEYIRKGFDKNVWELPQHYIKFEDCEVFRYQPPSSIDPLVDSLWNFYYFFYNKSLKRVFFFTGCSKLNCEDLNEALDDGFVLP